MKIPNKELSDVCFLREDSIEPFSVETLFTLIDHFIECLMLVMKRLVWFHVKDILEEVSVIIGLFLKTCSHKNFFLFNFWPCYTACGRLVSWLGLEPGPHT